MRDSDLWSKWNKMDQTPAGASYLFKSWNHFSCIQTGKYILCGKRLSHPIVDGSVWYQIKNQSVFSSKFLCFFSPSACLAGVFVLSSCLQGVPACCGHSSLQQRPGVRHLLSPGRPEWWDGQKQGRHSVLYPLWPSSALCLQVRTCMTSRWQTVTAASRWLWTLVWTGWWRGGSWSRGRRSVTPPSSWPWAPNSQNALGPLQTETGECSQVRRCAVMSWEELTEALPPAATGWWAFRLTMRKRRRESGGLRRTGTLCPGSDYQNQQVRTSRTRIQTFCHVGENLQVRSRWFIVIPINVICIIGSSCVKLGRD